MSLSQTPVSYGELIDKMTILQIKLQEIRDEAKLANVRNELELLEATWANDAASKVDIADETARLLAVNKRLWDIEDNIRLKERAQAFDDDFVKLARSVYFEHDERAATKREINPQLGSPPVEEQSYPDYRPASSRALRASGRAPG